MILYADVDLVAPDLSRFLAERDPWSIPWLADIPAAGSTIPRGFPICTLFATALTEEECRRKLLRRIRRVRNWFQ